MEQHFIDKAKKYKKDLQETKMLQREYAKKIGISQPHLSLYLKILQFDDDVLNAIKETGLNFTRVRDLFKLKDSISSKVIIKIIRYSTYKKLSNAKFNKLIHYELMKK